MTASASRDLSVENFKGVLIILVVIGHAVLTFLPGWIGFDFVFWTIYLVHMPAFAFVSGLVVRDPLTTARGAIRSLLPIYLGFSVLHIVMRALMVTDLRLDLKALIAPGLHWYILSLLIWRLGLFIVHRFSAATVLTVLLTVSLTVGFLPMFNSYFSASRTLVYAPFFYAGYYLGISGWQSLRRRIRTLPASLPLPGRVASVANASAWVLVTRVAIGLVAVVLLVTVGWMLSTTEGLSTNTVTGKLPYSASAGEEWWLGLLVRALVPLCTAAAVLAAAALLPDRRSVLTGLGTASLSIYLLHLYFIYPLGWFKEALTAGWLQAAAVIVASTVAVVLTQTPIAQRFTAELTRNTTRLYDVVLRGGGASGRPAAQVQR